jgi:autotransporter-associated beta strand protein
VVNLAGTTGGAVLDASGTGALEFTAAAFTATGAGSKLLTLTGNNTGANRIASAIVNNSATNLTSLTKAGTGSWELNGLSTYTGATSIQAGTLTVSSLANLSTASALGAPTSVANGTVALGSTTNTGTLVYTGGTTSTNRVINLAGTTGGAVLDASGTGPLTFTSAFTATGAGSKLLTLTGNNTGANTIAGAIVNNSATNLTRVAKTGDGTWVLSGANSFTGNLTVSAGTLRLGANGVLPDTAPVILAGGTLDVSGRTETAGTLTLTAPATIDFGASAAAIVFAASNGLTWSGATLTISNYGTGVDSLRFGANASALTATQLGKFRFADYGNVSGQIDAFGVVTPVPEPSAFAALAGLAALGGALWQRRRRSLTVPQHHQTS